MKCWICERGCSLPEGKSGACGMYENSGADIVELYPHRYLISCPISIETIVLSSLL
jgi:pyruvate formate lyase activating enzyme